MQKHEERKRGEKKPTFLDVLAQWKRVGVAPASSELECLTLLPGSSGFEQPVAPNASVILFREAT